MQAVFLIVLASASTLGVVRAATMEPQADHVFSSIYYDRTTPLAAKSGSVATNRVVTPIGSALGSSAVYSTNEQLTLNPAVSDGSYIQPALGGSRNYEPGDYSAALDPDLAYLTAAKYGRQAACRGCAGAGTGGGAVAGGAVSSGPGDVTGGSAGGVATPEPVSFLLMGIGLFAAGTLGRERRGGAPRP